MLIEQGLLTYRGITSDIPESLEGKNNYEKVIQSGLVGRIGDGLVDSSTLNEGKFKMAETSSDPEGNLTAERFRSGAITPVLWDTVDSNGEKINVHDLVEKVGLEETFKIQHKNLSTFFNKNDFSNMIKIW